MRTMFVAVLVVFALALAIGATTPTTAQAASCYYTCSCTGTPLRCCTSDGVTTCKVTPRFYCPQIVTC